MVKVMKKSLNLLEGAGKTNCGSWAVRKAGASCKGDVKREERCCSVENFFIEQSSWRRF